MHNFIRHSEKNSNRRKLKIPAGVKLKENRTRVIFFLSYAERSKKEWGSPKNITEGRSAKNAKVQVRDQMTLNLRLLCSRDKDSEKIRLMIRQSNRYSWSRIKCAPWQHWSYLLIWGKSPKCIRLCSVQPLVSTFLLRFYNLCFLSLYYPHMLSYSDGTQVRMGFHSASENSVL